MFSEFVQRSFLSQTYLYLTQGPSQIPPLESLNYNQSIKWSLCSPSLIHPQPWQVNKMDSQEHIQMNGSPWQKT